MKKLIIAAAIVCAAVASQAASVQWGVAGAASTDKDKMVYLLTAIDTSWTSEKDVSDASVASAVIKKVTTKYKTGAITSDHKDITKTSDFYLAIVEDNKVKYIEVTSDMQAKVYSAPDPAPGTYEGTTFTQLQASTTYVNLPEPTSAMLMLLGVAGLALKRKQK